MSRQHTIHSFVKISLKISAAFHFYCYGRECFCSEKAALDDKRLKLHNVFKHPQISTKRDQFNKMNADEAEQERIRLFEKTNLCADLLFPNESSYVSQLFDRRWAKRIEACPDYVEVAASAWAMTSTNWEYYPEWKRFFNCYRKEVQRIWMEDHDLLVLDTFPKPFTLYRGYNKPLGKMGLSWTLEKRVAAKIASGRGINSWIITASANPEDVVAYTDRRLEREIIIDPENILEIMNEEPMKMEDLAEQQNRESKPQTPRVGKKSVKPSLLIKLKCTKIHKFPAHQLIPAKRFAEICGATFKEGDQKIVLIGEKKLKIRCLKIQEESVQVKIVGVKEPQEVLLVASGKRRKSYFE